ncbi:MAG TPA: DUF433 domain-containing protein [Tepidisphaeraceae bacterium]|jgi:uncharacterized protein (DUF433 family)
MNWRDFIEENPQVMLGKPIFKGTRVTVEHVLRELGGGMSQQQLLASHPQLTSDHLRAALLYAAAIIDCETTVST